jgi:hypothetical protein
MTDGFLTPCFSGEKKKKKRKRRELTTTKYKIHQVKETDVNNDHTHIKPQITHTLGTA